jgi:periplasmic copper chaperone A
MQYRLPNRLLGAALGFALQGPLTLAIAQQSTLQIEHAWSRPAPAGRVGVLYCTITDNGAPDRLTGISTPAAARADLHQSLSENGIAKMRAVESAAIAPGKPLTLAPGGYHVMLMGLKQALKPGDTFPVTFTFDHAGAVTTTAVVQAGHPGMTMQMH